MPQDTPGRREQARRDHRADVAEDLRDGRADRRRVAGQAEARAGTERDWARTAAGERLRGVEARRGAERTRIDTPEQRTAATPTATLKTAAAENPDADTRRGRLSKPAADRLPPAVPAPDI
jgi:hypothetical protein